MSMFHKLSYVSETEVPERILKACEGEHPEPNWQNHLPVNLREITMEEFAQSEFFHSGFDYTRYNQCPLHKGEASIGWHEYWLNDGTGFALISDYWGKKVQVFRMGCNHEFEELGSEEALAKTYPEHAGKFAYGRCMHTTVCKTCHVIRVYDSSD